jgi:hypothetical protein
MSDHPLDLELIQIAVRVGMACAITAVIAVGVILVVRFLAGAS